MYKSVELPSNTRSLRSLAYNTGYTAHFVRSNRLSPTSHSPIPLSEIVNSGDLLCVINHIGANKC